MARSPDLMTSLKRRDMLCFVVCMFVINVNLVDIEVTSLITLDSSTAFIPGIRTQE